MGEAAAVCEAAERMERVLLRRQLPWRLVCACSRWCESVPSPAHRTSPSRTASSKRSAGRFRSPPDSVSTAALPTQGPPLPHVPRLIPHLFELLWSLCCRRLWPHCVFPSLLGPLNLFLQTLACSLARSLGAPHHRERKRAPVCKQALVSSVDAQGAERFNVYGPVKSVRPLKGPPASDCVRMCSWRARVCMRMHVLWSVQLRIACAGTAPQVRGHYDDWYVRYKAADGSQVRNGTGCCAEQAMARPDIPTVAAAKLALRLALVTLDVVVSGSRGTSTRLAAHLVPLRGGGGGEVAR